MRPLTLSNGYLLLMVALLFLLAACDKKDPVKLGFVGGLTGRVSDLGIAGRNGTTLAIEEWNRRGGINGRPIVLLVADDKQDPQAAKDAVTSLLDQGVVAVIGHMTSAMSVATLPLFNQRRILLVSPTTTTEDLTAKDDYFFRVCEGNGNYALELATTFSKRPGIKRVAVIYDLGNRAYSESYLNSFRKAFAQFGGEIVGTVGYVSGPDVAFSDLAKRALDFEPDSILMISSAVDTAVLAQQFEKTGNRHPLATSAWGGTERLLSLGGRAVEGMVLQQYFDRDNTSPQYLSFRQVYLERFGEEPGFASVGAYDASNLVLAALSRKTSSGDLKSVLLDYGKFSGIQDDINIDRFGDASRTIYSLVVRNGKFVTVVQPSEPPAKP